jgi:ABC-type phosphate transport system ATPase subunit
LILTAGAQESDMFLTPQHQETADYIEERYG